MYQHFWGKTEAEINGISDIPDFDIYVRTGRFPKTDKRLLLHLKLITPKINENSTDHQTGIVINERTAKIVELDVTPKHQGFGTEIVTLLELMLIKLKFQNVILLSENPGSTSFWSSLGYAVRTQTPVQL